MSVYAHRFSSLGRLRSRVRGASSFPDPHNPASWPSGVSGIAHGRLSIEVLHVPVVVTPRLRSDLVGSGQPQRLASRQEPWPGRNSRASTRVLSLVIGATRGMAMLSCQLSVLAASICAEHAVHYADLPFRRAVIPRIGTSSVEHYPRAVE